MIRNLFGTSITSIATAIVVGCAVPAWAAGIPPTGSLVCDASGREEFKPAVPTTPGLKDIKLKATGQVENCDVTAVAGGKAVINGGIVKVTGTMLSELGSCSNWSAETAVFTKMKATVKLQNLTTLPNGKIKRTTVATLKPVIETMGTTKINGGAGIELFGYVKQNAKLNAPFGDNRFSAVFTDASGIGVACANGTGPVGELTFDNIGLGYSAIFLNAN